MKIFRNILFGTFIFFCLFCSCSGVTDPDGIVPQEKEGIEKETENPDEDENETEDDETGDDETEDKKTEDTKEVPKEIPPAPVFLYCKTVSENEIAFGFSQPVSLVSLDFVPELKYEKPGKGKTITVNLEKNLESGQVVTANFVAEDAYERSIKKQVLFSSTATLAPALQINELRTEYSKPKAEFIEFKMLSDGNLGGLRVFAASNNKTPQVYEFAPVEVKEGEYVVLHMRTLEESCKDEYGVSLNESGGTDSCPTARDFWIAGSNKLLRKTDAVYVLDKNDWVLDAVIVAETPSPSWVNSFIAKAAELLFSQRLWESAAGTICSPADVVNSSGINTAMTKSISRREAVENTHTAADWYVTKAGGVSPGLQNKF